MRDHAGRFGFSALPLPDIDASLRELAYAVNTLEAEGLEPLTSHGNHFAPDWLMSLHSFRWDQHLPGRLPAPFLAW